MDASNQPPVRPPINRGATAPLYQRRQYQQDAPEDPSMRLSGIAGLSRIDESSANRLPSGAATTDTVRRTLGASEVTASSSSRPMLSPQPPPSSSLPPSATSTSATTSTTTNPPPQGLFTPPQTPAPSSAISSGMSSPRIIDSDRSSAPGAPPSATYFPMSTYQPAVAPPPISATWTPMAPSVSAASSSSITPSQLRRQSPQAEIKMEIETSPTSHTLLAPLGNKFTSDAITIAAKKNNVLQIMADRWDQEKDSHFEWLVTLDRDADMSRITAAFSDGLLRVTVRRRSVTELVAALSGAGVGRMVAGYS